MIPTALLFALTVVLLASPVMADDVTIQLDTGDGLSVQDSTATERLRIDDDGALTLGSAGADELCDDAGRGTTRFFARDSGDAVAVCTRTAKGDYLWQHLGGSGCAYVDEHTPQTGTVSSVGAEGSDFYAQSFIADVHRITQVGAHLREFTTGGQVRLAIAPDAAGSPDVANTVWESLVIDPSTNDGWVYVDHVGAQVTPGSRYYLVIDGDSNPGATGTARLGTSLLHLIDTDESMVYSNNGGSSWNTYSSPLAIHVQGCSDGAHTPKAYGGTCSLPAGSDSLARCNPSFSHRASEGEIAVVWGSMGVATTTPQTLATRVFYSTNNGVSWSHCGTQFYNFGGGEATTLSNAMAASCTMELTAGLNYKFAMGFNSGTTAGTSYGTITALVLPKP